VSGLTFRSQFCLHRLEALNGGIQFPLQFSDRRMGVSKRPFTTLTASLLCR
jgi:hypothetical protein